MITFKYIRELYENEKKSRNLQKLDEDFLERVQEYLKRKGKLLERSSRTVIDYSIVNEVENFKSILKNLFELRTKKILLLALKDSHVSLNAERDVFLDFERTFYENVKSLIVQNHNAVFNLLEDKNFMEVNQEETQEDSKENTSQDAPLKDTSQDVEVQQQENKIALKEDVSKYMLEAIDDIPAFLTVERDFMGPYLKGERFVCDAKTTKLLLNNNKVKILYEIK